MALTHPAPAALVTMSAEALSAYRDELRELAIDEDIFSPLRARMDLIDAIVADRKRSVTGIAS